MKTTVELPDSMAQRVRITAAQRGATFKKLVIEGLERVIAPIETTATARADALARLRQGFHFGGKPLAREVAHERKPVR